MDLLKMFTYSVE